MKPGKLFAVHSLRKTLQGRGGQIRLSPNDLQQRRFNLFFAFRHVGIISHRHAAKRLEPYAGEQIAAIAQAHMEAVPAKGAAAFFYVEGGLGAHCLNRIPAGNQRQAVSLGRGRIAGAQPGVHFPLVPVIAGKGRMIAAMLIGPGFLEEQRHARRVLSQLAHQLAQKGLSEAEESVTGLGLLVRRVGYEQFDVDSFNKACEEILGSDPDGVVIAPMFRSQTAVLTERLRQKGIPYVYIDSKLEEDDYMAYFGMPMYQSGYMCGALLTNGMPVDEAVMIRIRRDKNRLSDPTVNRRAGFLDYMQENFPDCKIHNLFIEPTDPAANATVLDGFFSEHPGIRHIVMFNSRIHLIVNYLEEHPERKWRVVGFDNLPLNNEALKRGTVTILIAQRPDEQVRLAVQALADKILFKKDPVHRDHYMPMDILTRFNVDYY